MTRLAVADALDLVRRRVQLQRAFRPIKDDWSIVRDVQGVRFNPGDRRNTQRTRENSDMRSSAAAHGGETNHCPAFHRGRIGRCEIFGNQNRILRILRRHSRDASEQSEHAQADIAHIVGALREQFVAKGREPFGMNFSRAFPGECSALALRDGGVSDVEEIRIIQQLGVRGEDRGLGRISFAVQLSAQALELSASFAESHRPATVARVRRLALLPPP